MGDPRDTARTWLIDQLDAVIERWFAEPGCDLGTLADAILDAPGVEVLAEQGRFLPTGNIWHQADDGDHMRLVIRLPAQPIGDGDG